MTIFDFIVADLKSKQYGNETYYFDKSNTKVAIIEHLNKVTFMFYDKCKDGDIYLATELEENRSITTKISNNIFVIPNIESRDDAKLLYEKGNLSQYAGDEPESIFQVIYYGLLEEEAFKGVKFSNSIIDVAVINPQGKIYKVPMVVDNGVCGCDGYPSGKIIDSYQILPIGIRSSDGIHILL